MSKLRGKIISLQRFTFKCVLVSTLVLPVVVSGQVYVQQGGKLVGSGVVGNSGQGSSVALSANGSTALIGGSADNSGVGAVWVFTLNNGSWTQQGSKLVGSGANGTSLQGISVALSADGNTALVGGDGDRDVNNNNIGAAWVFTRDSNGNWTQQGSKLVGTGATGASTQGVSVALSADGNTALVGGAADNNGTGAVWAYTRSNGVWTQQGSKLTGTGSAQNSLLGSSVALSADGNTAVVGGYRDNSNTGAVWVFTRDSNGNWTQQGNKLVGTGASGAAGQGFSVALSSDGNTALVGGTFDNSDAGAVWVFGRSSGVWTQEGNKLVGTGAVGNGQQGSSVALSGDGVTALIGGSADNNLAGAVWVFGKDPNGNWIQKGSKLAGSAGVGAGSQGSSVALSRNGNAALLGGPADNGGIGAAWAFTETLIGNGIGGYDFASPGDQAFAFDYNGSGYQDHIVIYRPGTGIVWILANNSGSFTPVYQSTYNASTGYGSGIGGYDLRSSADRMFAFDYNGTGKLDHLVLYRPGSGIIWILANNSGTFSPVYQSSFNSTTGFGGGIGGYDLMSRADQLIAFDFTAANTPNYILAYRPGTGIAWILGRNGSSFTSVYQSTYNSTTGLGGGIGGYDLFSPTDRIVAGYGTSTLGTGNSGELVLYRPGSGIIWVLKSNGNGTFAVEYQSTWNAAAGVGGGIDGYDLRSTADQLLLASTPGSSNGYALLYRPGTGIAWTEQCTAGAGGVLSACGSVYQSSYNASTGLGGGIGGYDLLSGSDRVFALDYSDSGALDHLVVYRPGTGIVWILQNNGTSFSAVYP